MSEKIHVIEASHYKEEELRLMLDPIIQQMAAEIRVEDVPDKLDMDSWKFIRNALDEYQKRGGKQSTSIGGPARAIIALFEQR